VFRRTPRQLRVVSTLCLALLLSAGLLAGVPVALSAQDSQNGQDSREIAIQPAPEPEPERAQWLLGAYYRHVWVPKSLLKPFLERAAGISNEGLGATLSRRTRTGPTIQIGLGYTGYHFEGAFAAHDVLVEDTEYITSSLGLLHLTGSVLWPIELSRMFALEIGVGVDLGVVLGSVHRTEAYPQDGAFQACRGALNPAVTGPDRDPKGAAMPYCDQAYDQSGKPTDTTGASVAGAHYNVKETRVPPVMLFPMLPQLALRFTPVPRFTLKLEAAFGIAQFWLGAAVQIGLGRRSTLNPAAAPEVAAPAPAPEPATRPGRLIGKLLETGTRVPIAHAAVRNKRVFSAIETDQAGLFAFEKLEPGPVHLEIKHPGHEAGSCDAVIPAQGGDVMVHCFLQPESREGAISGHVKDEQGRAIAGASVDIAGPVSKIIQTDTEGLWALLDAPDGTYRLRVQANGFFPQVVEIELKPRETALPQIILLPLPAAGAPR
jgi:hypothetical protein